MDGEMVEIQEAVTKKEIKQFIKFPWAVYKDYPHWVPPLMFDMKNRFNRKKDPFFEFGEAAFFLAKRDGKVVGRVTAHTNSRHDEYHNRKDGFFGYYECLNDNEASQALMKAAEDWLRKKGKTKIIGPENYTIYDEICFMLTGWDENPPTPVILENYNPPYYIDLMEKAGYKKEIDWYAFMVSKDIEIKEIFFRIKDRLLKQGFVFRPINLKRIKEETKKIKKVVHGAWAENWGHFPYSDKQFEQIAQGLKLIVDPRVCFMVEKDGEAVGCSVTLPDINPSLIKMNGRLLPFGWWHFFRAKKKAIGLRTFLFGVLKEYRNRGLDLVMVLDTVEEGIKYGYQWSECSLVVENNKKMIDPILKWGGRLYRTYRLFSKDL